MIGDVHFSWSRNGGGNPWGGDAFADDNTTAFGNHWAADWIEIGIRIPNSGWDGSSYRIAGNPTLLNSEGTGYHLGRPYLFGRVINAIFSRRTISQQFANTTVNSAVRILGSPSMTSSFSSDNFGSASFSSGTLSTDIAFVGGILYDFYQNYILPASNSTTPVTGPLGRNVTFSNNPAFRLDAAENISDEDLLIAFGNKF